MRNSIIFIAVFILLFNSVSAIELSGSAWGPVKLFEPGFETTREYTIRNYAYDAEAFVGGSLSEYGEIIDVQDFGSYKTFKLHIKFPNELNTPGLNYMYIGAKEIAPPDGGISALTSVQKRLGFLVLYDILYAKFDSLSTPHVNENEMSEFSFNAESVTTNIINNIWAEFLIYNSDKELINTVKTENFNLASAEKKSISKIIDSSNLQAGQYDVVTNIYWDENITTLKSYFNVGTLDLILSNYTKKFEAGQINKLNINIESGWNGIVNGVYAELFIDDQQQENTPTYSLTPFQKTIISGYIDLSYVEGNDHNLKIILHYEDQIKTINSPIIINGEAKELETNKVTKTSTKENAKEFEFNSLTMMIIFAVIVIILLIAIFILEFTRKK